MLHISTNIKKIRRLQDKTQEEFSKLLGVSIAMQKSYESGKANPDIVYIERLAALSGISFTDLMNMEVPLHRIVEKVEEKAEAKDTTDAKVVKPDTLDSLTQANLILAEANKTLADAHIIIARGNEELIALARSVLSFHTPTSDRLSVPPKEEVIQDQSGFRKGPLVNLKRRKQADSVKKKDT